MSRHFPIVYVRGYAMTAQAVEDTFNLPYYGFNLGATQFRQGAGQDPEMHIFESPVIRLMKDHDYVDAYGRFATSQGEPIADSVPGHTDWHRTLWVFRYYDAESALHGEQRPPFPEYAVHLLVFLNKVRQACGDPEDFRVNLVAHSMGGLISRCYLQNSDFFSRYADPARNEGIEPTHLKPVTVHKLFTFGTPHRGIRFRSALGPVNWVREATGGWREDQFTPKYMRDYLGLDDKCEANVYRPQKYAPPLSRTFSLVGTNVSDYVVSSSRVTVGAKSDGLVLTENAYIHAGPRAYVHRAHSGPHGIVNSEEGYQSLRRFLFGNAAFRARLRFGAVIGDLPNTDARDRLAYLTAEIGIAIRGLPGYLDLRNENEFTAEQIPLVRQGDHYVPEGETDPVLFTGYLFAGKQNKCHRTKSRDPYSRWVIDLTIKPHYERARRLFTSRFESDHFLAERLELALGDETAPRAFAWRWQNQSAQLHPAAEEHDKPADVRNRYVIDLPPPCVTRYTKDVQLVIDIMDWD